MNERIKELAEQAWDATAVSPEFGHPISFAERLAELIVKETMQVVANNLPNNTYVHVAKAVIEHFKE